MQEPLQTQAQPITEGLEEFFVSPCQTDPSVTSQTDTTKLSVHEAAKALGITERSIWRRIRAGKLQAKLQDGKTIVSLRQSDVQLTDQSPSVTVPPGQTDASDHYLEQLLTLLHDKDRELQAASFRNGYLEAQLESQKEQIKLLTDSQHRASWWARFKTWASRV
jgi:predicted DNA-binding transcriptional regulator AlpA